MMRNFKMAAMLVLAICSAAVFSVCSTGGDAEYKSTQSFEYHFYPDEYEEEYSEISETLTLEADTDYRLEIDANCQSGTMDISVLYSDEATKRYAVHTAAPCDDTIYIPANTSGAVEVIISIEADAKGAIIGDLFASN